MRVSEIRVKQIRANQGLGVDAISCVTLPYRGNGSNLADVKDKLQGAK